MDHVTALRAGVYVIEGMIEWRRTDFGDMTRTLHADPSGARARARDAWRERGCVTWSRACTCAGERIAFLYPADSIAPQIKEGLLDSLECTYEASRCM